MFGINININQNEKTEETSKAYGKLLMVWKIDSIMTERNVFLSGSCEITKYQI